ncbi:hypothetical protein PoB_003125700 [Plakobranchus ocellatus]|uniref:Uncharacterized protein n=1 Tax=Plakobranchus ocellatus TaxID=259542 RepID=A0AAV4ACU5_9GAST|nr:hypothetical protein PoB_003125700 [Plakobranchus ocellatus]
MSAYEDQHLGDEDLLIPMWLTRLGADSIDLLVLNSSDGGVVSTEQVILMDLNGSDLNDFSDSGDFDNPFDYPFVKFGFICLYSAVFLVCTIGEYT